MRGTIRESITLEITPIIFKVFYKRITRALSSIIICFLHGEISSELAFFVHSLGTFCDLSKNHLLSLISCSAVLFSSFCSGCERVGWLALFALFILLEIPHNLRILYRLETVGRVGIHLFLLYTLIGALNTGIKGLKLLRDRTNWHFSCINKRREWLSGLHGTKIF